MSVVHDEHRDWLEGQAEDHLALEELHRDRSALYAALVPALGELDEVKKDRDVNAGQMRFSYATLAAILTAVRLVLAKHGLAISQRVTTSIVSNTVSVSTRILHVSGEEFYAGRITLPLGQTPQAMGSAISYIRRYAVLAALGISSDDEDDDGQAASQPPPPKPQPPQPRMASKTQMQKIGALMDEAGLSKDDNSRRQLVAGIIGRAIKSRAELTADEASAVIDALGAVVSGTAQVEIGDSGDWRVVLVDPQLTLEYSQ